MTASISFELSRRGLVRREDRDGARAERCAPLAIDRAGRGNVEARELRAGSSARRRRGLPHVRHRRSQIVGSGIRGGDLQQEQAGNGNGHRVAEFTAAICAHLVFSSLRATAAAIRARNSSIGIRRMPSVRNVRVAVSNTAKALESCVTVSLPVRGSREIRKVPSTQPATVNPPAGDRSRNTTASSPGLNLGVPSTVAVRCPTRPPGKRTAISPGKLSLHGLHDLDRRHRPDRAVFPARFGARTAHARHGVGSRGQLIEAEPRERGGANGRQESGARAEAK